MYDHNMSIISEIFLLFTGVFLLELLTFNFLMKNPPYIPGDLYLDKLPYKIYVPISSAIIGSILLKIFMSLSTR